VEFDEIDFELFVETGVRLISRPNLSDVELLALVNNLTPMQMSCYLGAYMLKKYNIST
jgi:hypothetical protein|tara:strand:+ start:50 stop:223 length:174 start_codon:yes stop_codon:yes gene_type:complete